jgi:hypothetical protein
MLGITYVKGIRLCVFLQFLICCGHFDRNQPSVLRFSHRAHIELQRSLKMLVLVYITHFTTM